MPAPRFVRTALLIGALSGACGAQTLDLGSLGPPILGERSVFNQRADGLREEALRLLDEGDWWNDHDGSITLRHDEALASRARGTMRWLAVRSMRGEGARGEAADHRAVVGVLLERSLTSFDERADAFLRRARVVHTGDADTATTDAWHAERAALAGFVRRSEEAFGTPDRAITMGFTIRSFANSIRPALSELVPILNEQERRTLATAWSELDESPEAATESPTDERVLAVTRLLDRTARSVLHAPESRRLLRLIDDAERSAQTMGTIDPELGVRAQEAIGRSAEALIDPGTRRSAIERLDRLRAFTALLEAAETLRSNDDMAPSRELDGLIEDFSRAALGDSLDPMGTPTEPGNLVQAMRVTARALRIAGDRRTLSEPQRMTGHTRRAWLLMHSEQEDREEATLGALRGLAFNPRRATDPSLVSSIGRVRRGYERLLALRMSDGWLDELREDGRLAVLLGPGVTQRQRDLLVTELRGRIRDAADRDVREDALDALNTLRDDAERFGRTPLEDRLAQGQPVGVGAETCVELGEALDTARTRWVEGWIEDDNAMRERWATHLALLCRARELVAFAIEMDSDAPMNDAARLPVVLWPENEGHPLRDRVRGLARAGVREALRDDPSTMDDNPEIVARLTTFEDHGDGARALEALASAATGVPEASADAFVRAMGALCVLPPGDHPVREHRHDVASYVRWVHELHYARERNDRDDADAILRYLDEVGADVLARVSSE